MGIEEAMPKCPAHKNGRFFLFHIQINEAIPSMTQILPVKVMVHGEKSCLAKLKQKGDDLLVSHALSAHFISNLVKWHVPIQQELTLALKNILVENVHAGVGSSANSSECLRNASADSFTASAMASFVMLL